MGWQPNHQNLTDDTSGTIARLEVNVISTSQTNLIQMEMLTPSGITSGHSVFGGNEEFDRVGANIVSLTIRDVLVITRCQEEVGKHD